MEKIRIGSGAGYSGDRIEPAVELVEKGNIQYLVFECLAERTIAIAQQAKMKDPNAGYDGLLVERMEAILAGCKQKGIKIITNMGAANPIAGAKKIKEIAMQLGITGLKIAAVTGDDVVETVRSGDYSILETGENLATIKDKIVSANAYLGTKPIVEALKNGADVIITGRVADPALFLAPLIYEFNWSDEDWDMMGQGTVIGHLLECAGQITGGYFADPGYKDVQGLARLGFPIAEVQKDGTFIITKVPGSGGKVTLATCKEQLMYEIHNPVAYITPDVVADFTSVEFTQVGEDQVQVKGGKGLAKTDFLKASIGYIDSYMGEGQISYAGPGAVARGKLALKIVEERLKIVGVEYQEVKFDLIGIDSLHGSNISKTEHEPYEVRVRVTGRTQNMKEAIRIGNEVETLYTNGPAGGGGATKSAKQVVAMVSALVPRSLVNYNLYYEVV
ncbi:acyclic terpene utilization AtuA family protein [Pelosinus sp. IPA-1]|uniref:acyclic terpene utilization AtuA family protein n=1 Tax=Pelosinus sp. IPA-1 TaxID=3029569 RepID=UPI0024361E14|nr:acyclic terpene utilization AtuA family protein [Pelosinus sp. IPA-1]GMA98493.1 ABC transporter substrate-binding protein [Pelosinus sp. IPA-1]